MKRGPDLDLLVAERIMGWKVIKFENIGLIELATEDDRLLLNEFRPSRDIVDAWKVVERFKGSRFSVRKGLISELQQVVTPDEIKASGSLLHESELIYYLTPLSICIAGLRAIGIEVPND